MKTALFFLLPLFLLAGCKKSGKDEHTDPARPMYFPPVSGAAWETTSPADLGWNQNAVQPLKDYLLATHTKAFIILVNGRIVMEEYFNGHTASDTWQWNSAGKTLVAATIGIAQQQQLLQINEPVNRYLGAGWTSAPLEKENLITIRHLLTMTSGLNDSDDLVIKRNLGYLADAGTRWSYHNVFQKLMDVVTAAGARDFKDYFDSEIKNKIGMDGFWNDGIIFRVFHSRARSMARFGLLALNKGKWNNVQILNEAFFTESVHTSQELNPSYGYFWWLNGSSRFMLPGSQNVYPGTLVPAAPPDMYAAMGAADQRLYVIPSKQMVVVRMGEASDPADPRFEISGFDNSLWQKINALMQ